MSGNQTNDMQPLPTDADFPAIGQYDVVLGPGDPGYADAVAEAEANEEAEAEDTAGEIELQADAEGPEIPEFDGDGLDDVEEEDAGEEDC